MNKVILDPTHIRQQAIDDELLVDHSALAEKSWFLTGVASLRRSTSVLSDSAVKKRRRPSASVFASLFSTNKGCAHRLQAVAAGYVLLPHANF